jgi:hypothetical protein
MGRKLMAGAATLAVALSVSACSHAVTTQGDAVARINSGTALNARPGTYQIADVRVTLVKVVSLPDDELGLRFSFVSNSPNCCSLFPRVALAAGPSGERAVPSTEVVILRSDVKADGTLEMQLSEKGGSTVPFTINLGQLGVSLQ